MKEFAIFCGIVCLIQLLFVAAATANEMRLFNHDLGWEFPTPYAVFLIIVPGSFIIVPIAKFVIDFVSNTLEKRKYEKEIYFKKIENKYDGLVKNRFQ